MFSFRYLVVMVMSVLFYCRARWSHETRKISFDQCNVRQSAIPFVIIISLHRMHTVCKMWPVATDVTCSMVCLSVCHMEVSCKNH